MLKRQFYKSKNHNDSIKLMSLGDFSNRKKQEHLSKVIDVVNKKLRGSVVRMGLLLVK